MQVARWPSFVFRGFGIANLIFACLGLRLLAWSLLALREKAIGNTSEHPYFLSVFWTMTSIDIVLLTLLIIGGIRLLQLGAVGVVVCNLVFVAEIIYFAVLNFAFPVSRSIVAAFGPGMMALGPQLICGYPLVALVFLNLARRRHQTLIAVAHHTPV